MDVVFRCRHRAALAVFACALAVGGCASIAGPREPSPADYPAMAQSGQAAYIVDRLKRLPGRRAKLTASARAAAERRIGEIEDALRSYLDSYGWQEAAKLLTVVNPRSVFWGWCCQQPMWEAARQDPMLGEALAVAQRGRPRLPGDEAPRYRLHPDVARRLAAALRPSVEIVHAAILAEGAAGNRAACRAVPVRTGNGALVDEYLGLDGYETLPTEFLRGCAPSQGDYARLLRNRERAERLDFDLETEKFLAAARERARGAAADCTQRGVALPATLNEGLSATVLRGYRRFGGDVTREDVTVRGRPAVDYVAHRYAQIERNRVANGVPISVEDTPLAAAALAEAVCRQAR